MSDRFTCTCISPCKFYINNEKCTSFGRDSFIVKIIYNFLQCYKMDCSMHKIFMYNPFLIKWLIFVLLFVLFYCYPFKKEGGEKL